MNAAAVGGRCHVLEGLGLFQRAGGQGEAGAGAGEEGCSGAMAVGAGRGAALGFFFAGAGFLATGPAPAGRNSTKTGFGTRRWPSGSPSAEATTRTGTVCGW